MSLVAGMPRPVFSGESTRVLDTMCASFRRKNSIPLLGNHLGCHFFLEGGGSLSQRQRLGSPVLITAVPAWLSEAPSPGLPFFMGPIRDCITHTLPLRVSGPRWC